VLKAKALGLNTIQTHVPWNLHELAPGKFVLEGFANIEAFLNLCHKLGPCHDSSWTIHMFRLDIVKNDFK